MPYILLIKINMININEKEALKMASKTAPKHRSMGSGSIYKKGNRFYLRVMIDGKRKAYILRNENDSYCTTKDQAKEAADRMTKRAEAIDTERKYVEAVAELRDLRNKATVTAAQLWEMYEKSPRTQEMSDKEARWQKSVFSRFSAWMRAHGASMVSDITPTLAGEYMAEYGKTVSNKTFNEVRTVINRILKVAVKASVLLENPLADVEKRPLETISRQEFTEAQVQKIFDGFKIGFFYEMNAKRKKDGTQGKIRMEYKPLFKDEMEVLLKLCCFTGCDGENGCLMRWDNVDLDKNEISYVREKTKKTTKKRKVITLPIHDTLRSALLWAKGWQRPDSPYILPNVADRYIRNHDGIQKDVMKIIRIALGVETTDSGDTGTRRKLAANIYSLHSFRHTFVSFCANAGVPMAVVASIVGHGNPAMTRHYAHISAEAKGKAIGSLPSLLAPAKQKSDRDRLRGIIENISDADVARVLEFIASGCAVHDSDACTP